MPGLADTPATPALTEEQSPSGARAIFSFPVALGALLVLMTMFSIRSRFGDPDTWWHLKTGELIWNTHSIPTVDSFSFTAYGHPWVAQEWLSELTMYGAWKLGGNAGLMLWLGILASLLIVGAYVLCTAYSGNCKVAFLGGVIVWLFSTIGLAVRPHMVGYLLLVCELLFIRLGRTRDSRWFLTLPALFAVWINVHSSFFFGVVVLGVILLFSFVEFRVGFLSSTRWPREKRNLLTSAFVLSVAALFLNPIGPKLVWYPVDVMLNQPLNIGIVSEWQQISFSDFRGSALLCMGGLVLLVPLLRRIDLYASELFLAAMGFGFAIRHERMLFVFGILTAPVLCRLLASTWERYDPRRDNAWAGAVVLGLVALGIVMVFPSHKNIEEQIRAHNPVQGVEFLKRSNLHGNLLNDYVFGGYLIWAAPERKVSMDGRADLYESAGVLVEQARWALLEADPNEFLDKYGIGICLLSRNAPMTRVLPLLPGWKRVYRDDLAVIFARPKS